MEPVLYSLRSSLTVGETGFAHALAQCCPADPYLSDSFLGDFLFRVARSNFAETGG
jgi:hypothetical protein